MLANAAHAHTLTYTFRHKHPPSPVPVCFQIRGAGGKWVQREHTVSAVFTSSPGPLDSSSKSLSG